MQAPFNVIFCGILVITCKHDFRSEGSVNVDAELIFNQVESENATSSLDSLPNATEVTSVLKEAASNGSLGEALAVDITSITAKGKN